MKILKDTWIFLLCLALCCSCTQDENDFPSTSDNQGPELCIRLTGDFEMDTRSELNTSEPQHHIEHMYAYLFAAPQGTSDWTKASCIYEEKLPWVPSADAVSVFRCRLQTGAYQAIEQHNPTHDPSQTYLVMVIGVDNHPETYAFPAVKTGSGTTATDLHLGMKGKNLNEVKLQLSVNDPQLMSYTEVFAGYNRFTTAQSLINVHLTRRVAGVLCYLKDIPAKINDYHIIGVELHCNGGVNQSGVLQPDLSNAQNAFITLNADNKLVNNTLLASVNLKELGAEPDANGSLLYIPAIQEPGVLETVPNTVLLGAYLLPIHAGAQFSIRLVGETRDASGQVTSQPYVFKHTDTDGYYLVKNAANQSQYPLLADYIYQIGSKAYATQTDYDDPLSLKGKSIVVDPQPWESLRVEVDFPNTQLGMVVGSPYLASFKHNCLSTDDQLQVKVLSENYRQSPWVLTTSADWLWLINDAGQKVKTMEGVGDKTVNIHLENYINAASPKKKNPDEDYRETQVVLQLKTDPVRSTTTVRQWNALIVTTCNNDNSRQWEIGFSRLDNGATFNLDGSVNLTGVKTYKWAYKGVYPTSIFDQGVGNNTGDDGLANYFAMEKESSKLINQKHWGNSVVKQAHIITDNTNRQDDWYVPARIEMNALLHQMQGFASAHFEDPYVTWWTATAVGGTNNQSYIGNTSVKDRAEWWGVKDYVDWRSTEHHRVRLAHKILAKPAN